MTISESLFVFLIFTAHIVLACTVAARARAPYVRHVTVILIWAVASVASVLLLNKVMADSTHVASSGGLAIMITATVLGVLGAGLLFGWAVSPGGMRFMFAPYAALVKKPPVWFINTTEEQARMLWGRRSTLTAVVIAAMTAVPMYIMVSGLYRAALLVK